MSVVRLENHPHWNDLSFGTQRMLIRALHQRPARRYQKADDLVEDLEKLAHLFDVQAQDLIDASEARTEDDPEGALAALDAVRVRFPSVWPSVQVSSASFAGRCSTTG